MKWSSYILLSVLVVLINCSVTLLLIDYKKEPPLQFAIIDSKKIAADLSERLSNQNLDDSQRAEAIKRYTTALVNTVAAYETQTGTIVLKKESVAVPKHHDITQLIQNNVKY
ncbi:TrbI F-type domain-containing protein [Vibrio fluvialis]|nr:TrbI F-type domain-containing protein [Vibrio fluvialis]